MRVLRGSRVAAIEADALVTLSTLLTASTVATSASTVQLTYQTLFSLWSLSYSPEAALEMASSKLGLIAKLVEIVKTSPKEKVIRVALSTLQDKAWRDENMHKHAAAAAGAGLRRR